jgi:hypothetical protein
VTTAVVRAGTRPRTLTVKIAVAVTAGLLLALGIARVQADPAPSELELRDATPVPAETIEGGGGTLLAVKQWTPKDDLVLICENYEGLLPMRPADLWLEVDVPASGRVLVSVSATTANSEPGLADVWGLMVGDEVVAETHVGRGDTEHRVTARFLVELPPGPARIDVAHRSDRGGSANLFLGPSYGPATIEVWAA